MLAFRFGGDFLAAWGAFAAAAAYARATGGVVFDDQTGEVLTPDKAAEIARDIERDMPRLEEIVGEVVRQVVRDMLKE